MMPTQQVSRLRTLWITAFIFICSPWLADATHLTSQLPSHPLSDQLRARIEALDPQAIMHVQGTPLHATALLIWLYRDRAFQPGWIGLDGLRPQTETFLQVVRGADREGLNPAHYHVQQIDKMLQRSGAAPALDPEALVDVEFLLTDAIITYAWHLRAGRISPETINEGGATNFTAYDLVALVRQTLDADPFDDALQHLSPAQAGYARLRQAVATYQAIAAKGGWPRIPEGPKVQKGDRGPRVAALYRRLLITGDLEPKTPHSDDLFDGTVELGLRRFQERHGLAPDGTVGPATLAELNVPVEMRLRQLTLNMERWRWLPENLGERHITVNIPNFALQVVEQGRSVLSMRVVVGRPTRPSPVFSADMTYLVLSPHWYVPPIIALEDKLPLIRKDPSYVARQNFRVFQDVGWGSTQIDPLSVNWSTVTARNFPYRLRQDPGPMNALGRVKFMLPNRYQVYLHDTPSKTLFAKTERAYSSGCIRLEKPIELAEYLLGEDPKWSRQKILAAIATSREQTVRLSTSIPVHLLYWTAWVNEDGVAHFRRDIYSRDTVLEKTLRSAVPKLPSEDRIYTTMSRL